MCLLYIQVICGSLGWVSTSGSDHGGIGVFGPVFHDHGKPTVFLSQFQRAGQTQSDYSGSNYTSNANINE